MHVRFHLLGLLRIAAVLACVGAAAYLVVGTRRLSPPHGLRLRAWLWGLMSTGTCSARVERLVPARAEPTPTAALIEVKGV
jgi:hypothetical protein